MISFRIKSQLSRKSILSDSDPYFEVYYNEFDFIWESGSKQVKTDRDKTVAVRPAGSQHGKATFVFMIHMVINNWYFSIAVFLSEAF